MNLDDVLRARLDAQQQPWDMSAARRAAVLAPIVARDGEDHVLFLVRAKDLRLHAGQIAFPGGGDAGDADPVACALRETEEEIGVPAAAVTVLGSLPVRRSSSGFCVHCLVGRLRSDAALALDPREVARALFVPLAVVADAAQWQDRVPPAVPGQPPLRSSPHLDWHGDVIWGLTGRFAWELGARVRG